MFSRLNLTVTLIVPKWQAALFRVVFLKAAFSRRGLFASLGKLQLVAALSAGLRERGAAFVHWCCEKTKEKLSH